MILLGILDMARFELRQSLALTLPKSEEQRINKTQSKALRRSRLASRLLLKKLYEAYIGEFMPEILYTEYGKPYFQLSENGENEDEEKSKNGFINCADKKVRAAFSISHDRNLVAAVISDTEENIGLDIQSLPDTKERIERVEKRFLSAIKRGDFLFGRGEAEDFCEGKPENNEEDEKSLRFAGLRWLFFEIEGGRIVPVEDFRGIALLFDNEKNEEYERHNYNRENISSEETKKNEDKKVFVVKESSFADGADFLRLWTSLEALVKLHGRGLSDNKNVNEYLQKSIIKTLFLQHGGREWALSIALERKRRM